jgi:hypothetical protein
MPLQATSGAASYDAFGGGISVPYIPQYIEDVFSTWLYTGNGSSQTITNNIDLAGKGGLVWVKRRNTTGSPAVIYAAGATNFVRDSVLFTHSTGPEKAASTGETSADVQPWLSTGFGVVNRTAIPGENLNSSNARYASWTFRKQPKFFDVVRWTGDGFGASRTIQHALGSLPGCIIVKALGDNSLSGGNQWWTWHRSLTGPFTPSSNGGLDASWPYALQLHSTEATGNINGWMTGVNGSKFDLSNFNVSGQRYVAYLFAHNAGGFGLTGTDNVISCGSFTTDGSGVFEANLGYEPQWLLLKRTDSSTQGDWNIYDNMRGWTNPANNSILYANLSAAETTGAGGAVPNATGFRYANGGIPGSSWIYIAIRRGPMRVPTTGTSVFGLVARTGTGAGATVTGSARVSDAVLIKNRSSSAAASLFSSRLTGTGYLVTSTTAAEVAAGTTILQADPWDVMDGVKVGTTSTITNASANNYINYLFSRAPGFFDVVCYTGNSVATRDLNHNLQAIPTFLITKNRSSVGNWAVACAFTGAPGFYITSGDSGGVALNTNREFISAASSPFTTATLFRPNKVGGGFENTNTSGSNYVTYLFGNCPGVSFAGTYSGNGATTVINCGFTSGARFVLIKSYNALSDWLFWDSARGIVAGNDPYLALNSTAAEVTTTDWVDTAATGFELSNAVGNLANTSGRNYIFLAIA